MTPPATMRAFLLTGHGDLDMLEYRADYPVPVLAPGEVLIEVAACGMNNTDVNTRTAWYQGGGWGGQLRFPRIQGADPVGRITAVGDDVDHSRIGERVLVDAWIRSSDDRLEAVKYLGSERDGGYAQYVAVPAINAHFIDTGLSDVDLASFPCSYGTAEHMLHRPGASEGQGVLVPGAAGGGGSALVQLARRRGAKVVALTSRSKISEVGGIGADIVLDRAMEGLDQAIISETGGIDVFADVVGGESFPSLFGTINHGGHYTTAGAIGGQTVLLDLRTLYLRDITMHGATVLPAVVFRNLVSYIERGEIRPLVAATYPLQDLKEAQTEFMKKSHVGGFVIEIGE